MDKATEFVYSLKNAKNQKYAIEFLKYLDDSTMKAGPHPKRFGVDDVASTQIEKKLMSLRKITVHDLQARGKNESTLLDKIDKYINEQEEKSSEKSFDVRNIEDETLENDYFRKVLFTGKNLQLVLMSLKPGEEIGMEVHDDVDQFFRIDEGNGEVRVEGKDPVEISDGFSIVIPQGTKHNIINTSETDDLKLYTLYSPPNHPPGTIHKTKDEAMKKGD